MLKLESLGLIESSGALGVSRDVARKQPASDRQCNTRPSGSDVEGVGVQKSPWHEAELGDVEVAESLPKLE